MKTCKKCGVQIPDFGRDLGVLKQFCVHCGAEQGDSAMVGGLKFIGKIALFFLVICSIPYACEASRNISPGRESYERGE